MIKNYIEESFTPEWIKLNITDKTHELVIFREIILWDLIISFLTPEFHTKKKGGWVMKSANLGI